jgi:nucleoid-associated protein YgaU
MQLGATLSKPVGPLPLGAWIAVIGVGGYLGLKGRSKLAASSSAAAAVDPNAVAPVTDPGGAGIQFGGGDPGTPATPSITTNQDWASAAISYVIAHGKNAADAQNAITKFLAGTPVNPTEYDIITLAIAHLGAPPEGAPVITRAVVPVTPVPPVKPVPPPAKPPVAKKPVATSPKAPTKPAPAPALHRYTVQSGDTLSGIGARLGVPWGRIYSSNAATIEAAAHAHGQASSGNGNWIYPGESLVIA